MSKDQFEQFLAQRPQLAMKMLEILGERVKEMDAMIKQLALGNIRDRMLHLLHKLSQRFGVDEGDYRKIDVRLSHQEIANMVGATRESVTVVLNELAKEGVIQKGRLYILVHSGRMDALLKATSTLVD